MKNGEVEAEKIYIFLGRFAVEFEDICHTMESGVRCILAGEGLGNEKIQEVLLAGLTAEPLRSLFHSLCYEHLKPNEEETSIIDTVFKKFQELIGLRNDLLHTAWALVFDISEDEPKPIGIGVKLHKKKTGSATKQFKHGIEYFEGLNKIARLTSNYVSKLVNCIAMCYPLARNFKRSDEGEYEPLVGLCVK